MRKVRLDHVRGTEFTVITFADWTATSIWDRGNGYVFLDTEGGDEPEYFVVVRSTGSDLQASLWRDRRERRDLFLRNVKVRRRSPTASPSRCRSGRSVRTVPHLVLLVGDDQLHRRGLPAHLPRPGTRRRCGGTVASRHVADADEQSVTQRVLSQRPGARPRTSTSRGRARASTGTRCPNPAAGLGAVGPRSAPSTVALAAPRGSRGPRTTPGRPRASRRWSARRPRRTTAGRGPEHPVLDTDPGLRRAEPPRAYREQA